VREPLGSALTNAALFVPKFLAFLVILIVGWLIAKVVGNAVDKLLERVHFDRAVERGGIKKALAKSTWDASTIVGKLVYYTLLLFVLQMAFGVFGPNPISDLIKGVIEFLPRLIVAIIIVVVTAAIAAALRELIANTLGGLSYGRVLANVVSVFVLGLGIIAALNQVGIATTVTMPVLIAVLATVAGILIVGVGGGLIRPMQSRWERYLTTMAQESDNIREQVRQAPSVKEQAEQAKARQGSDRTATMETPAAPPTAAPSGEVYDQGYPPAGGQGGTTQAFRPPAPD
jgi:hypothetical protein